MKSPEEMREYKAKWAREKRAIDPNAARAKDKSNYSKDPQAAKNRKKKYLKSLESRNVPETTVCVSCGEGKSTRNDYYRCEQPCKKCRMVKAQIRRATPEGKSQRRKEYSKNKEKKRAATRAYAKAHPQKIAADKRAYSKTPNGRRLQNKKNWKRRAILLNATTPESVSVTPEWFDTIKALQGGICAYCDLEKPLTMDHRLPLARGGKHVRENIVACCKSCNSQKSDRTISEWRPWLMIESYGLELASA